MYALCRDLISPLDKFSFFLTLEKKEITPFCILEILYKAFFVKKFTQPASGNSGDIYNSEGKVAFGFSER